MRRLLTALTAAVAITPATAQGATCSQARVRPCIRQAINVQGLGPIGAAWMFRVARCESRFNPYARGAAGEIGVYQFMPGTWRTTPYRRRSPWSARWNSRAAAWMYDHNRSGEWTCK